MSLTITYDGTLNNLILETEKISKMFRGYSPYSKTLSTIKTEIIANFEKYSSYSSIYISNVVIKNTNGNGIFIVPYVYHAANTLQSDTPLYNWFFTQILLWILLLFVVMIIITFIYAYIVDVDLTGILFKNFNCTI